MDQQNLGSKRSASEGAGKITAKSHEAAEQLKEAVVDQANLVRDKARSAKERTTERIRGVATQFEHVSNSLREEDPFAADLAERASNGVASVARYVSATSPQTLMRDAERLARRQPAMFFGGAFLLGLVAGRFLKSSAPQGGYSTGQNGSQSYRDQEEEWASRQNRQSGFFPSTGSETRDDARFRENYDATFARDAAARPSGESENRGQTTPPPRRASGTSPEQSGIGAAGKAAGGRGNLP